MLEFYLQTLADLAHLPDDAPEDVRELMEGALFLEQFFLRECDLDEGQCIERVRSFKKFAADVRSGAARRVQ